MSQKPIHVYYERPSTWSLLPKELKNLKILDLGCGSGWYCEQLVQKGADVTAVDISDTMIQLTNQRVQGKARCFVLDLEDGLPFKTNEFDIVLAPLVIHYIKEWGPLFVEISRVLKGGCSFIFSTHQMQMEAKLFNLENYYEKTLIVDCWENVGNVQFYHHTLHELSDSLYQAGFVIERILEPEPSEDMKKVDFKMYDLISKNPWFLFVKAIRV